MGDSLKLEFSCVPLFQVPGDLSFLLKSSPMHLKNACYIVLFISSIFFMEKFFKKFVR